MSQRTHFNVLKKINDYMVKRTFNKFKRSKIEKALWRSNTWDGRHRFWSISYGITQSKYILRRALHTHTSRSIDLCVHWEIPTATAITAVRLTGPIGMMMYSVINHFTVHHHLFCFYLLLLSNEHNNSQSNQVSIARTHKSIKFVRNRGID